MAVREESSVLPHGRTAAGRKAGAAAAEGLLGPLCCAPDAEATTAHVAPVLYTTWGGTEVTVEIA